MVTNAYGAPSAEPSALITARALLDVEAVLFRPDPPFIFTSGWASPVYTDCRKLISYPRLRAALMDFAVERLRRDAGLEPFDAVAGGETAGIPFAAWLSDRLALPMLYVRKKPKGFGRDARIEGDARAGQRVLLVEDLATDGRSKVGFVEALREAGCKVGHVFVIFHYGIYAESREVMDRLGVRLHALATWWDVLQAAKDRGDFPAEVLTEVEAFLHDPVGWSAAHGGKADAST